MPRKGRKRRDRDAARELKKSPPLRLEVRNMTDEEADALARDRGMTQGEYFRLGGAEEMLARETRRRP